MISILIPTYNNFNYLKLCLKSLVKNSSFEHEILFHINDGSDGTLDFIRQSGYKYTYSENNIGLCSAINKVAKLVTKKYKLICFDELEIIDIADAMIVSNLFKALLKKNISFITNPFTV